MLVASRVSLAGQMKRRKFIRNTAFGSTLPFWLQQCDFKSNANFPIEVHSDHHAGHLLFESQNWSESKAEYTSLVIVGGGLSGLAAAYKYRDQDFQLFELSDRLGGTASSRSFQEVDFCQGAHYDLDYPEYYGEEVLSMLEELQIIEYQKWKKAWSFRDRQHLIPSTRRQQCYQHGVIRGDVIPEGEQKKKFLSIMEPFLGEMKLPTTLIKEDLRYLDELNFVDFLAQKMEIDDSFRRYLDYHMMDDYGGTATQVSALAGIHYFMCRPYYREPVSLFSPPSGNDYFVKKIATNLPLTRLKSNHLVASIEGQKGGFTVRVLDILNKRIRNIQTDRVVYAGQKHALKYVYPKEYPVFEDNLYAPWMVINFFTGQEPKKYGFWQNEYLGEDPAFLGFIDSSVQDRNSLKGRRVLTAYYCLKPQDREVLKTIPENKDRIVAETLEKIESLLKEELSVDAAFIKVMGHAMPIPQPGYLFSKKDPDTQITYAGVDNGRLPLLFEALDSGLQT